MDTASEKRKEEKRDKRTEVTIEKGSEIEKWCAALKNKAMRTNYTKF